jgi:predicted small metal-binding protein
MAKLLRCQDVFPGCSAEVRADTEQDVLREAAQHAAAVHGVKQLDDATVQTIKAQIRAA